MINIMPSTSVKYRVLYLLKSHNRLSSSQIETLFGDKTSRSAIVTALNQLEQEGLVRQIGKGRGTVYEIKQKNASIPGLIETKINNKYQKDDPPLIDLEITNPVTYFKLWWKKVIGNEGVDVKFSFKIKPLTAMFLVLVIAGAGYGVGRITALLEQTPVAKYLPLPVSETSARLNVFTGRLHYNSDQRQYFLITNEVEGIRIQPMNFEGIGNFRDKYVYAIGVFDPLTRTLNLSSLEIAE